MQSLFSRTQSRGSTNSAPAAERNREFIERAVVRRPPTPPANVSRLFTRRRRPQQARQGWFTRRRENRIVPMADEDIFSAPEVEPISVAMPRMPSIPRENSNGSNKSGREYPAVIPVDLNEFPETDIASEMPYGVVDVVGIDGRDCCLPGRYAQDCRICPERMQPPRDRPMLMRNPSAVEPEQKESGGRKRKRKTVRRGRKRQLKKRHYKKSRKQFKEA
jgi:hypothetical protein